MPEGAFYRVTKYLRDNGPKLPVPEALRVDVNELRDRAMGSQRLGIKVSLSPYMLTLLGLERDGSGEGHVDGVSPGHA